MALQTEITRLLVRMCKAQSGRDIDQLGTAISQEKVKMAKTAKAKEETGNLILALSKASTYKRFAIWIVGDTPLITHAWSQKAKLEMLSKQVKAVKAGKEARNPEQDFVDSLYDLGVDKNGKHRGYGFPTTGVKNCILSAAHKDKGIARSAALGALWLDAQMVRVRPALSSAICDMPLSIIYGGDPDQPKHPPLCREDMVKIGAGLNKVANLAYRAQFTVWGLHVTGKYNSAILSDETLGFLIVESGMSSGLGEWRNERKGMFGSFHLADEAESAEWDAFRDGRGPLPLPANYREAAE